MKRAHVNLSVSDLNESVAFYTALFGAEPAVLQSDYAKWSLADPALNFAIAARGGDVGIDHLGIEVGDEDELAEVSRRFARAGGPTTGLHEATCCYAESEKDWTVDPVGTRWEAFLTHGSAAEYGTDVVPEPKGGCCGGA